MDLSQYEEAWSNSTAPSNSNEEPPDGKYEVEVKKVELRESQAGKPYMKWQMMIDGEKCNGRWLFHSNQMATKDNLGWLRKDLNTCGVKVEKLSELEAALPRLVGVRLQVTKKSRNERNYNLYLDKALPSAAAVAAEKAANEKEQEKDGLPF